MKMHQNNEGNLIRADIPKLGITFLHKVETPDLVKTCFPAVKAHNISTTPSQIL